MKSPVNLNRESVNWVVFYNIETGIICKQSDRGIDMFNNIVKV